MSSEQISKIRKEYVLKTLTEDMVMDSPFEQFSAWFKEACDVEQGEANAFALATVGADGAPSLRTVLLKKFDEKGFVFFTNYESRKAQDIAHHNRVAMLFYWPSLERQLRIEGMIEKISEEESDLYFTSRPLAARLGAIVSRQSKEVVSRAAMDEEYQSYCASLGDAEPTRPTYWGGYRVVPHYFEFWQGRESRLHDRIVYSGEGINWGKKRLWP